MMDEDKRHHVSTMRFLVAVPGRALPRYEPVPGSWVLPIWGKMGGIGGSRWWSLFLTIQGPERGGEEGAHDCRAGGHVAHLLSLGPPFHLVDGDATGF